jgi:hypothetical protein
MGIPKTFGSMKRLPIILLFLSLPLNPLLAGTTGSLEGFVRDKATNEPLVGCNVLLVGTQLGAAADVNGFYIVNNIPAGSYDIQCTYIGYQTLLMKNVRVVPDLKTRLDLTLESSQVELGPVEVVAERPLIQKDVTGTLHTANDETFKMLTSPQLLCQC